jgi:hypothetical protein
MSDPLSAAVSAVTLLATCISCAEALYSFIKGIHDAPSDLLNLSNEVHNLQAVLVEVNQFAEYSATTPHVTDTLDNFLTDAKEVLGELEGLLSTCKSKPLSLDRCVKWLCRKGRAKALQARLSHTRSNIVALLTANNA